MSSSHVGDRRWFVEQNGDDGFLVRRYHRDRASSTWGSKQEAVEKAREYARSHSSSRRRSQVKVRSGGSFSRVEAFVDGERVKQRS